MKNLTLVLFVFLVACSSGTQTARADFTDSYIIEEGTGQRYSQPIGDFGTWTMDVTGDFAAFPGNYLDTTGAPGTIVMDPYAPAPNGGSYNLQMSLSNTAAADGVFSFSYDLVTGYNLTTPNSSDRAGYFVNGDRYFLPLGNGSGQIADIALFQGDTFGFFAEAGPKSISAGFSSQAQLTVSNFSAPELGGIAPVPEPSAWILCGSGLIFLAVSRLRMRRKTNGCFS